MTFLSTMHGWQAGLAGLGIALACTGPAKAGETNTALSAVPRHCTHPTNTTMPEVVGIDVSKWQGQIRFDRFPRYVKYVFVKATQGAHGVDPDYASNIQRAHAAGLAVGSYHYFIPGTNAGSQFAHFAQHASVEPGDLPPVIDIEVLNNQDDATLAAELKTFLSLLETRYGSKPVIYTGRDFANRHLKGFDKFPLWLAEYTAAPKPVLPLDWQRWTFWQKSQSTLIEGIAGCVDLDSFNGDAGQFQSLLRRPATAEKVAAAPAAH